MLRNNLTIFPGISYKRQRYLRGRGIITWEDLLRNGKEHFPGYLWEEIENEIYMAIRNYDEGNIEYFKDAIDRKDYYILYHDFKGRSIFLDIETTGMSTENDITIIGISDSKKNYRVFVNGINLYEREIIPIISKYSILVTFYGTRFDVPFIYKKFRDLGEILLKMVHIDLCFLGHRVGFKGGLKSIEKQVGLEREDEIEGLTGFDAVRLWKEYKLGRIDSLIRLIRYNRRDVLNLIDLIEIEIKLMSEFYP
jgi:uncharacterized protein YprB with RNaseH-like and TPR domain